MTSFVCKQPHSGCIFIKKQDLLVFTGGHGSPTKVGCLFVKAAGAVNVTRSENHVEVFREAKICFGRNG